MSSTSLAVMKNLAKAAGWAGFVLLGLLVAWFRLSDKECRLPGVLDAIVFAVAIVLYPLAVVDADRTALYMQFMYLGTLVLCCILIVCCRIPLRKTCTAEVTR